jgi:transposase-like protein
MGKGGQSEEEILRVLREAEAGETVVEVCRKHGISLQSFYLWKKKYSGLGLNELRELRQLRDENGKLKRLVAECLTLHADAALSGEKVATALDNVVASGGTPKSITMDNGTEFASKAMDLWAYNNGVHLDFIRSGQPVETGYIESFNGRLRDECLNVEVFFTVAYARRKLGLWQHDYNHPAKRAQAEPRRPKSPTGFGFVFRGGSGFRVSSKALTAILVFPIACSFRGLKQPDAQFVGQRNKMMVIVITFPGAYCHDATIFTGSLLDMKCVTA